MLLLNDTSTPTPMQPGIPRRKLRPPQPSPPRTRRSEAQQLLGMSLPCGCLAAGGFLWRTSACCHTAGVAGALSPFLSQLEHPRVRVFPRSPASEVGEPFSLVTVFGIVKGGLKGVTRQTRAEPAVLEASGNRAFRDRTLTVEHVALVASGGSLGSCVARSWIDSCSGGSRAY